MVETRSSGEFSRGRGERKQSLHQTERMPTDDRPRSAIPSSSSIFANLTFVQTFKFLCTDDQRMAFVHRVDAAGL